MDTLRRLQELFKRFPGIGERQAMRFAYFIATSDEAYVRALLENISSSRQNVKRCKRCFALSEKIIAGKCPVCSDESLDHSVVLVVEKDADRDRFIRSKSYSGTYFLLGGLAPAIERDVSSYIRLNELKKLISEEFSLGLKEVILALSATPDGERTEALVLQSTEDERNKFGLKFSVLGKGLSTGTEIEYSDADTLLNALQSRKQK